MHKPVQGSTKRRALSCEKFLSGPAWVMLSKAGPPFSGALYNWLACMNQAKPSSSHFLALKVMNCPYYKAPLSSRTRLKCPHGNRLSIDVIAREGGGGQPSLLPKNWCLSFSANRLLVGVLPGVVRVGSYSWEGLFSVNRSSSLSSAINGASCQNNQRRPSSKRILERASQDWSCL